MIEIDNIKYKVCCPVCENTICVKGTISCEAYQWAKRKIEELDKMKELYETGKDFRSYVDKYCIKHEVSIEESFTHSCVRNAYNYYKLNVH